MTLEERFNNKIRYFRRHPKYAELNAKRKEIIKSYTNDSWHDIADKDFFYKIIAMSEDYILDWLDGKGTLTWTKHWDDRLKAILNGYVEMFDAFPRLRFDVVSEDELNDYLRDGWQVEKTAADGYVVSKVPALTEQKG